MAENDSSLDAGRRSHACPGVRLWMILLLFTATTATRAQTPETLSPPPEYKIEVVLFENLQASARNEDPGPIPCFGIATAGSPMGQIFQYFEAIAYDLMGLRAFHVRNKANTAAVMLKCRII